MKIKTNKIIKVLTIATIVSTIQPTNAFSAGYFNWFWNFLSTNNNPILKPTINLNTEINNAVSTTSKLLTKINKIPKTEISHKTLSNILNCTEKSIEAITNNSLTKIVIKPAGWFSREESLLVPKFKNITSKYAVELYKKLLDSRNKMIGCIKENLITNEELKKTCNQLLEKLEVYRKETNWEYAKLQWEEIKLYVRNLLETPFFSNPYVKWTLISLITSYLTYKIMWRGIIYKFYKWCKDETPTEIYKQIEKIKNNHAPQNQSGYMSNETKLKQITALTKKLEEYNNKSSIRSALSWVWNHMSKEFKVATGTVGTISTIIGTIYLGSLYNNYF
ncbi:hypothetical protein KAT08_02680 [Candidatus Babeliales bacterium]|nr:hypothetical protein [Candidatus Babeliales bacterium]